MTATDETLRFTLVTGNAGKLAEARRLCGGDLDSVSIDLPEIQSLDIRTVLLAKGKEAARHVQGPLVVEETALELDAMSGFPGPLVRWMLDAIGPVGIARSAASLGDTRATARCVLLWTDGVRQVIGEGTTRGQLVSTPRGTNGFGWDPVFQPEGVAEPEGKPRTYGELSPEEKDRIGHRGRAWRALLAELNTAE